MRPNFNRLFKPEYVKAMNANKDSKVSYHDYIQSKLAEARKEGKEAPIEMHRIVMDNYMGPYTDKNDKKYYLCSFNKALDQTAPEDLVQEDTRYGLRNNFQRDKDGNFIQELDESGNPKTTVNKEGQTVPVYKNASLQRVDEDKFKNLMKNGIHSERLTKDGKRIFNAQNQAIDYVVFKAAIQSVEKPVRVNKEVDDGKGHTVNVLVNVLNEEGRQRVDKFYAPVLDYIQTKDMEFDANGKAIPDTVKTIPAFDPAAHFANVEAAKTAPKYADKFPAKVAEEQKSAPEETASYEMDDPEIV